MPIHNLLQPSKVETLLKAEPDSPTLLLNLGMVLNDLRQTDREIALLKPTSSSRRSSVLIPKTT